VIDGGFVFFWDYRHIQFISQLGSYFFHIGFGNDGFV
jgi:hypothetical protein